MTAVAVEIGGRVDPGFEAVREAFAANFERHREAGAACCVHVGGRPVVDLWGGLADAATGRPYDRDTLQLVFSTTKGATALCCHMLAERGELDLDAPVARYWPEFRAAGKDRLPVRWLLTHQAGLPALDRPVTVEDLCAWDPVVDMLAAQAPLWEPGTAFGYHARTYGFLVGEVIRRVTGHTVGAFFAKEVAAPLDLDFFIGLPEEEEARVAPLLEYLPPEPGAEADPFLAAVADPSTLAHRVFMNPALPVPVVNSRAWHAAEIPSSNGICTAASLSRMYAACIGDVDGVRLLSEETMEAARAEQVRGLDAVILEETAFATGFMVPTPHGPMAGPGSFGHPGLGGSLGFAHPETGVAFGYVMNQMQAHEAGDPRPGLLVEAVMSCIR